MSPMKCEVMYWKDGRRYGMECFRPRFDGQWLTAEIAEGVRIWVCRRGDLILLRRIRRRWKGGPAPVFNKFPLARPGRCCPGRSSPAPAIRVR